MKHFFIMLAIAWSFGTVGLRNATCADNELRRLPPVSYAAAQAPYLRPVVTAPRLVAPATFVEPVVDEVTSDEPPPLEIVPQLTDLPAIATPLSASDPPEERSDFSSSFNVQSADFERGVVITGIGAVMKIGGYVKADFIEDFDPITATDLFDTTTIPTRHPGNVAHKNARFHARQSRLNLDARWNSDEGPVRIFVEGDFFSEGNRFRMRHAYGEMRQVTVGQTWTTFTDVNSLPNTLDFEGSAASVNLRRAQVRWRQPLYDSDYSFALAIEDPRIIVEVPTGVTGDPRTELPDLIARLRFSPEWGSFQVAGVTRVIGYQPTGLPVGGKTAWGLNFAGSLFATEVDKLYYQIVFGDGIGSFRGLPDAAPIAANASDLLTTFSWMIGWTHEWNSILNSNFTYSDGSVDNTPFQDADALHQNSYFAVNLIWKPSEQMFVGIEYLYGTRTDRDGSQGFANRVQMSFGFHLP